QWQYGFERQLPRGWKLEYSHSFSRTWHSLITRNINAPIIASGAPDVPSPRPFGIDENILAYESSGLVKGQVVFVGINQTRNKILNLYSGYLFFNFHNNSDGAAREPQYSYNLAAEWARPFWQSRHRAFVVCSLNLPLRLRAFGTVNAASGTPFNIT